jgi:hypothetical protein
LSLRKSPVKTPALLAANRLNAQKCTGPKTSAGKARAALNALKHGQRATNLPAKIQAAGYHQLERVFQLRKTWSRIYRGKGGPALVESAVNSLAARTWFQNQVRRRPRSSPLTGQSEGPESLRFRSHFRSLAEGRGQAPLGRSPGGSPAVDGHRLGGIRSPQGIVNPTGLDPRL